MCYLIDNVQFNATYAFCVTPFKFALRGELVCLWRQCLILYILYQIKVITAKVRHKKIHQSHANHGSYVAYV